VKTEKLTRKEIIDQRLKEAGWDVANQSKVVGEFDILVVPASLSPNKKEY
jgi:type I restriction enzyme, R subunit